MTARKIATPTGSLCPDGRLSTPTRQRDGVEILDIDNFVPFFLSSINNALASSASNQFRERYGIGISEWKTMAMLAIEPGITAARICEVVKLDKAAASRSLGVLDRRGYLTSVSSARDARKRRWWLNEDGYQLHNTIIGHSLARERTLIEGADPEDLEATLRVLRLMMTNLPNL